MSKDLRLGFLLFQSLALAASSAAQCSSESCRAIVAQEFRPDSVVCYGGANGSAPCSGCAWQVLDLVWCARQTSNLNGSDSKRFDLYARGASGDGTAYTKDCRAFIEGGGSCVLQNVSAAVHSISAEEIGLSVSAVTLEIYHYVTIVWLKFDEACKPPILHDKIHRVMN